MTISGMEYNISQAADNYRRSIEFGNQLLVSNFEARYDFYTQRKVEDARARGISEDRISRWVAGRSSRRQEKIQGYRERLNRQVEQTVKDYVHNLRARFGMIEEAVEED